MYILIVIAIVATVFGLLVAEMIIRDKNNRKRYAPIIPQLKRGVLYPRWRLEEMLAEHNQDKKNE